MSIQLAVVNEEIANQIDPQNKKFPEKSLLVYAINDENKEIVGRTGLLHLAIIEGTEIFNPSYNNTRLLYKLVGKLEDLAKESEHGSLFAMGLNSDENASVEENERREKIKSYLKRLGYEEFPGTLYVKDFSKDSKEN